MSNDNNYICNAEIMSAIVPCYEYARESGVLVDEVGRLETIINELQKEGDGMITVQGIQLKGLDVVLAEEGGDKISGKFNLMSNIGKVIAKQGFNSYGEVDVVFNSDTMKRYNEFIEMVKQDIENVLGINEG